MPHPFRRLPHPAAPYRVLPRPAEPCRALPLPAAPRQPRPDCSPSPSAAAGAPSRRLPPAAAIPNELRHHVHLQRARLLGTTALRLAGHLLDFTTLLLYYSTPLHSIPLRSTPRRAALLYSAPLHSTLLCSSPLYSPMYSTPPCSTLRSSTSFGSTRSRRRSGRVCTITT